MHQKKPMLRDRTDRAWFSRFEYLASKRSGSILSSPKPSRGFTQAFTTRWTSGDRRWRRSLSGSYSEKKMVIWYTFGS